MICTINIGLVKPNYTVFSRVGVGRGRVFPVTSPVRHDGGVGVYGATTVSGRRDTHA